MRCWRPFFRFIEVTAMDLNSLADWAKLCAQILQFERMRYEEHEIPVDGSATAEAMIGVFATRDPLTLEPVGETEKSLIVSYGKFEGGETGLVRYRTATRALCLASDAKACVTSVQAFNADDKSRGFVLVCFQHRERGHTNFYAEYRDDGTLGDWLPNKFCGDVIFDALPPTNPNGEVYPLLLKFAQTYLETYFTVCPPDELN